MTCMYPCCINLHHETRHIIKVVCQTFILGFHVTAEAEEKGIARLLLSDQKLHVFKNVCPCRPFLGFHMIIGKYH